MAAGLGIDPTVLAKALLILPTATQAIAIIVTIPLVIGEPSVRSANAGIGNWQDRSRSGGRDHACCGLPWPALVPGLGVVASIFAHALPVCPDTASILAIPVTV